MKTRADVVALLGTLCDADRAWIVGKLPSHAKSRLLAAGSDLSSATPASTAHASATSASKQPAVPANRELYDVLVRTDPQSVINVLRNEPAWLIAAVLSAQEWPWHSDLLMALAPSVRSDVTCIQKIGTTFAAPLIDSLVRLVASRASSGVTPQRQSKFETLVSRLAASRSKKRLSLHL